MIIASRTRTPLAHPTEIGRTGLLLRFVLLAFRLDRGLNPCAMLVRFPRPEGRSTVVVFGSVHWAGLVRELTADDRDYMQALLDSWTLTRADSVAAQESFGAAQQLATGLLQTISSGTESASRLDLLLREKLGVRTRALTHASDLWMMGEGQTCE